MADIDRERFVEVSRKEYLTLLMPIAEQMGVDVHDVLSATMDHSGIEFEFLDRRSAFPAVTHRTARIHVFDPVML